MGEHQLDFDAELRLYNEILSPAWGIKRGDHVVDIGCGAGQTAREAARLAVDGSVLGVDQYEPAIARARKLAEEDGLGNVAFECVDVQVHEFPEHRFDLAISRFGTMFFRDAVAAFANIGRALRPGGRLVMLVWQAKEQNEWAVAIEQALGGHGDHGALNAFSLGEPTAATEMLQAAGFADVAFTDVRQPVYYGPDTETALAWVGSFATTKQALEKQDPPAADQTLGRLRAMAEEHLRADGVWFDSAAWIVSASKAG